MNKRDFIKTGLLGVVGLSATNIRANGLFQNINNSFSIPELPYSASEINKVFSEDAFKKHYKQEYTRYNKTLNKELTSLAFKPKNLREILTNANQYNKSLIESACGYYNHRMFFKLISPKNNKTSHTSLNAQINKTFGSKDKLFNEFTKKATELENRDGWLWLVSNNNTLMVIATQKNINPLLSNIVSKQKGFPILNIDMWKHAYKENYSNNKEAYLHSVFESINWKTAEKRFKRSKAIRIS